jgi:hypothetical protein
MLTGLSMRGLLGRRSQRVTAQLCRKGVMLRAKRLIFWTNVSDCYSARSEARTYQRRTRRPSPRLVPLITRSAPRCKRPSPRSRSSQTRRSVSPGLPNLGTGRRCRPDRRGDCWGSPAASPARSSRITVSMIDLDGRAPWRVTIKSMEKLRLIANRRLRLLSHILRCPVGR